MEKRKSGMPAKTPRMMRRDKRRRAIGVKIEDMMMKGLEEEERRDNNGFGPENGL